MSSGTYGGIVQIVGPSGCGGTTEKWGSKAVFTGSNWPVVSTVHNRYGWRYIDYEKTVTIKGKRVVLKRQRRYKTIIGSYVTKRRKVPLVIEPHPFNKTWENRHETRVGYRTPLGSASIGIAPTCFGVGVQPADPWTGNDTNALINKLHGKVAGSDFNLASAIGAEGKDTLKFIAETASRISRSITALKRGHVNKAISTLTQDRDLYRRKRGYKMDDALVTDQTEIYRNVANEFFNGSKGRRKNDNAIDRAADSWLNWQLAAAPLLGDVKAAAEQLAQRYGVPQTYRQKASNFKVAIKKPDSSPGAKCVIRQTRTDQSIVYYYSEALDVPQLSGILDPEVVLWNALPWSFVADWFIPIGSWLEARGHANNLSGKFVLSVKTNRTLRSVYGVPGTLGGGYAYINGLDCVQETGSFVRTLPANLNSLIRPPRFVPLSEALSWKKAITGVSLVFSAFRQKSIVGNYLN
ncbi:maturation protein [ssRNA phage SRR6960799_13]|uniref:Maturation protein n=1 Tax=ssRNA phage SRR6960799_13 TaxID=2786569 RepID=A0A8S5L434_9VIRU|nr:maturation protein [ssRNA phage SRR6960799_13]DAD52283.1 TPA_asm: maturation protein [ssRNA phage SRR6960799_13]